MTKARGTVMKVAAVNRSHIPEHVLDEVMPHEKSEKSPLNEETVAADVMKAKADGRLIDLFKSRVLFVRTCIILFNWLVISKSLCTLCIIFFIYAYFEYLAVL